MQTKGIYVIVFWAISILLIWERTDAILAETTSEDVVGIVYEFDEDNDYVFDEAETSYESQKGNTYVWSSGRKETEEGSVSGDHAGAVLWRGTLDWTEKFDRTFGYTGKVEAVRERL